MTNKAILIITSLIAAVLGTLHISDDIVRGIDPGGPETYTGMLIVVVWLYATLVLTDRRWGLVLILLLAIGGAAVPYLHMRSGLAGGRIANTSGMLLWVWTLFMLGVTSIFTAVLSVRGLWSLRRQPS